MDKEDGLKMLAFDDSDLRTMLMSLTLLQANATQEIISGGEASTLDEADISLGNLTDLIHQLQEVLSK